MAEKKGRVGVILGKFYPIHKGHLNMILEARMMVDELHLFVCSETQRDHELYLKSQFQYQPSPKERVNWVNELTAHLPNISIHHLNEDGLPPYPHGWQEWTERTLAFWHQLNLTPSVIFSSEPQDRLFYEEHFQLPVTLMDPQRKDFPISATKVREAPHRYWDYIPLNVRPAFTHEVLFLTENTPLLPLISSLASANIYRNGILAQQFSKATERFLFNQITADLPFTPKQRYHALIAEENHPRLPEVLANPTTKQLAKERVLILPSMPVQRGYHTIKEWLTAQHYHSSTI